MFSSILPKSHRSPFAKLRQGQPQDQPIEAAPINMANPPPWTREEYADLRSRDKVKVKAAVRRFMDNQVRNDWTFTWPPPPQASRPLSEVLAKDTTGTTEPSGHAQVQDELNEDEGYQAEDQDLDGEMNLGTTDDIDKESEYEIEDEDETAYVQRIEWDSDSPPEESLSQKSLNSYGSNTDPEAAKRRREAQRRRANRKEMEWNDGLACFEQRRNAWTEAKTIMIRKKPCVPTTPSAQNAEKRRSFFKSNRRSHSSASSQAASNSGMSSDLSPNRTSEKASNSGTSTARSDSSAFTVVTVVPRQNKFLPPDNPLRASITSERYLQLYDKVISNNLQPSCPINLADMLGSCVAGWTRDGEFSPRPALPLDPTFNPAARKKNNRNSWAGPSTNANTPNSGRRLSITSFLRGGKDSEARSGKGMRQSLSQAFGFGGALPSQTAATPQGTTAG